MWFLVPFLFLGGAYYASKKKVLGQDFFGPLEIFGPFMNIESTALAKAKEELIQHEGRRNDVYRDTRGFLTVGIGHKVIPTDNLVLGQRITDAKIDALFKQDTAVAFEAAKKQAKELGRYTPDFIAALTAVNFQLGTGWKNNFENTYLDLKKGNEESAIRRLKQSAWYNQTPVRVAAFIEAIQEAYA